MTDLFAVRNGASAARCFAGVLLALALVSLPAAPAFAANAQSEPLDRPIADRLQQGAPIHVVLIARGDLEDLVGDLSRQGVANMKRVPLLHGVSASLGPDAVRFFARDPHVLRVTYDAPVRLLDEEHDSAGLPSVFRAVDNALQLPVSGRGIGVAVVDSGIAQHADLAGSVTVNLNFVSTASSPADEFGHGTAVAGVIGGDGTASGGRYAGMAARVNLINLRVNDGTGAATTSDIINAILWAVNNKDTYNIRVMNLSLTSSVAESYLTSPLDAAVEYAWMKGIIVVVAAGNLGPNSALYAPANDPYVITVGATDDAGTVTTADDHLASFSSYGVTQDGFAKPDLVAPGRRIVAPAATNSAIATAHPANLVGSQYIQLSGTSLSAAQVSGIAALYLESHPWTRPGHLKAVLMATAHGFGPTGTVPTGAGAGYVDAGRAIAYWGELENANNNLVPSPYLQAMYLAAAQVLAGTSVSWGSVSWGSVSWGSVSWGSVSWADVLFGGI
jgi:serine protease AprX